MRPSKHDDVRRARARALTLCCLLGVAVPATAQTACDADLNGDGMVGSADITGILSAWGPCTNCAADLDGDGAVGAPDIAALLSMWGAACQPLDWATVLEFAPNPSIVTDPALRDAIAATGLPWRVRDNAGQIELLLVPPGTFEMGCSASIQSACAADESPVHPVTLTNAFYIGRFEVTQAQWTNRMGSNPSYHQGGGYTDAPTRPVEQVNWGAAQAFMASTGLRLPTEAEWERAYRAGTTTAYHSMPSAASGTNDGLLAGNIGWYLGNQGQFGTPAFGTRPVGQKAANALGIHDMAGNVSEWTQDWYSGTYYASSPAENPTGPSTGTRRSIRGGSWADYAPAMRSSDRFGELPNTTCSCYGFRVARNP